MNFTCYSDCDNFIRHQPQSYIYVPKNAPEYGK
jgi:hypothetical protein